MNLQQCLKILELETAGSLMEAKRTYKDLVRVWHPDRFQNNPRLKQKADQRLREINLAYSYLCRYLSSNPSRGLSIPKPTSPNSPSSNNVAHSGARSGSHRAQSNSRTTAENNKPEAARFAAPASKAVPRTSSIGRYVLLAALFVMMAILALVVYFSLNTDKIASKTRGKASEAMDKIVDKLEKTESIPKNDSPVQRFVEELDRMNKSADSKKIIEIHLDSGSIIMTEAWWEQGDMIMYRVDGGSMGIESSRVKKIVKRK
jgi:hypothetical protein